jgi:molecular chaperone IbpA
MRTDFDFAPLYRATVGFDRIFDMLDSVAGQPSPGGYPPYNIEKTAEDAWCIVLAVAGFTEAELNITQKEDELLVTGKGRNERNEGTEYLYRGIGARDFERRFQLADHVRVTAAKLENGLLSVELQRELPEEKKPRAIPIEGQSTRRRITQQ